MPALLNTRGDLGKAERIYHAVVKTATKDEVLEIGDPAPLGILIALTKADVTTSSLARRLKIPFEAAKNLRDTALARLTDTRFADAFHRIRHSVKEP